MKFQFNDQCSYGRAHLKYENTATKTRRKWRANARETDREKHELKI